MTRSFDRRTFLKGAAVAATASAVGLILPDEEPVRRFWQGWTLGRQRAIAAELPDYFETGRFDASMPPFVKRFDVIRIDDEIMFVTGISESGVISVARGQAGTKQVRHEPAEPVEFIGTAWPEYGTVDIPRRTWDSR